MITAVDSNVVLDVLLPDPANGPFSLTLLKRAAAEGALVFSEIVCAELGSFFENFSLFDQTMEEMGIALLASSKTTLFEAGVMWKRYKSRRIPHKPPRVVADFLVGAHALNQADRLLTRDRGFYRDYFTKLQILT